MVHVLLALILLASPAFALTLDNSQADAFRGWFTRIVWEQLRFRPNKRWVHRDCAGLVRFAMKESFAVLYRPFRAA